MREMSSFRRRFVVVGTMADSFRHCFATFYQMSYNDDDDDEVCLSPTLGPPENVSYAKARVSRSTIPDPESSE